ncbi:MAG: hypothetical protein ACREQ5_14235 [Candidatus Dormibacteria bacterium]
MANGKRGDHPLTDILVYGVPTFGSEVDSLILSLNRFGIWQNRLTSFFMLGLQDEPERLQAQGQDRKAATLLHNFAHVLHGEERRLQDADVGREMDE